MGSSSVTSVRLLHSEFRGRVSRGLRGEASCPHTINASPDSNAGGPGAVSTVADVIVRRVLNKVRRARNMSSLHALLSLPKGRARRSKHNDITASVVDLSAFVS